MPEGGWPEVPKPFTNEHGQWKLEGALEAFKQSRAECVALRAELGQARADVARLRAALKKITQELSNNHQSHYTALDALDATFKP